ncbi:high-potential iron-sulfur protein [Haloferax sp. DFSO52]|uniref:high-potential iron-sulfur protein n=1 Tax=Haloferax sp. DFSO52 TaxID=3388505 RepID=UPI003A864657
MTDDQQTRRRFIWLSGTATMAGLAGCAGGGGDTGGGGSGETETDEPTTASGGETGGVPEEYATATSIGGTERNPEQLSSQDAVAYQDEPKEGQQCSDCSYYIEDKNGDGVGACSIVEGEIAPDGYCVSFVAYDG